MDSEERQHPAIGCLREGHLHASLKALYRRPGDRIEVPLEGFVIDLVQDDGLTEIQTGSFSALGRKLDCLLDHYRIRVVHPVGVKKWIVKTQEGATVSRRRSPRPAQLADVCKELASFPTLLDHPNFTWSWCPWRRRSFSVPTGGEAGGVGGGPFMSVDWSGYWTR